MTVAELRVRLANLPGDKIVVIEDADTNWALILQSVTEFGDVIELKSDYQHRLVEGKT